MRRAITALLALLVTFAVAAPARAASRFFFSGDGTLAMHHAHFDQDLSVRYRDSDGNYDAAALKTLRHFFRSRQDGAEGEVSLRLIELIDYVEDRYHPAQMSLVSGYRSPEFNDSLRGKGARAAKSSLHTEGMAADIQFKGLELRQLWDALRGQQIGGVGLYRADGFLHLDTGPPRFWEPQTSKVEKNLAADNKRLFARTDFDRYDRLEGAIVRLHSLTVLPVGIKRNAKFGTRRVGLEPLSDGVRLVGECYVIERPAERYEFRLTGGEPGAGLRLPIVFETCAPLSGKPPRRVKSNAIERLSPPPAK